VGGSPTGFASPVQQSVIDLVHSADPAHKLLQAEGVERFAFYERAQRAYVIVQTGELAPYANFIFKKGVIN
jgi:L-fucose mutarotase